MNNEENIVKTGTTTVGIVCKDGIVLAADKRATAGYLIADKQTQKLHKINERIAVTMAGTASDGQLLVKLARAETKLKDIRTGKPITVKEAANLVGMMIYNNIRKMSMIPGISHFLMGGVDNEGFHLYDLFADGTVSKMEKFVASGSGSVMAYGVLETLYKEDIGLDEGNGIVVFKIAQNGVEEVADVESVMKIEI